MAYKMRKIEELVKGSEYYNTDDFCRDAKRYIKAVKEGRIIVNIASVSKSGMSRKMKFLTCEKNQYTGNYQYCTFYALFKALGWNFGDRDTFQVNGCGMAMVFNTNYNNIHDLYRLGFMTKKTCDHLAQQTPTVI